MLLDHMLGCILHAHTPLPVQDIIFYQSYTSYIHSQFLYFCASRMREPTSRVQYNMYTAVRM